MPADATPGKYIGQYRVICEERSTAELAVELTVWDFALPPVPELQTALGSPVEQMRGYYLALLERAGLRTEAEKIVRSMTESFSNWEKDAATYARAGEKLAAVTMEAKTGRAAKLNDRPLRNLP